MVLEKYCGPGEMLCPGEILWSGRYVVALEGWCGSEGMMCSKRNIVVLKECFGAGGMLP